MTVTRCRCINLSGCSLAGQSDELRIPAGERLVCPKCAAPLVAAPITAIGAILRPGGLVVAACLLFGAGCLAAFEAMAPTAHAVAQERKADVGLLPAPVAKPLAPASLVPVPVK